MVCAKRAWSFSKKHQLMLKIDVGYSVTSKQFYQNELSNLDDLDFKMVDFVSEEILREGSLWGLPEENLVGFNGPKGLFSYARQKLSSDRKWLLIASLAGSVKLAADNLNVESTMGLVCVYGDDWRKRDSSAIKFGSNWAPMTEKALGTTKSVRENGLIKPISGSMVTRGIDGTLYEHWVVLPCMPESINKKNGKAYMKCEDEVYVVEDAQQVQAVMSGKATWIVPDEHGNFVFA